MFKAQRKKFKVKMTQEEDIKKAIETVANSDKNKDNKITILPSYTALLKINKMKF